ncbi:MAG: carbamoyl-phosphate synthase large subunit [Chloroflexi bacterium]|nr:carbamoyl-phosphate synthase large subunit [Chloroflexota bacterium]
MALTKLLVANRGEIAIRIMRAAADLGITTVAIYPQDDSESLHAFKADETVVLPGRGARAYLDIEQVVAAAKQTGCDAVHPGYGFLAENAAFARTLQDAEITFVGPTADTLELFGDKIRARELAAENDVPVLPGTKQAVSVDDARGFFESLAPGEAMILKAVAGGGGRGTRAITSLDNLRETFDQCSGEALVSFGNGDLYAEQFIPRARHIEVQVLGDGSGEVVHMWERECSIQRRFQKVVEIAPAPGLPEGLRDRIIEAATRMASAVDYRSLGTFEFLADAGQWSDDAPFYFMEANARLQVEHTVTEAVTGIDLVQSQLKIADGRRIADLGLEQESIPEPRGYAIQTRVNMETITADGQTLPSGGTLTAFDPPSGPGIRTDTYGYTGYTSNPSYDSLVAKLITHSPSPDFEDAVRRTYRALSEFRIEGVPTNLQFLQTLLQHEDFTGLNFHTRFIEEKAAELATTNGTVHPRLYAEATATVAVAADPGGYAGAQIDTSDPLALFNHDRDVKATQAPSAPVDDAPDLTGPDGSIGFPAPIQGTIVSVHVTEGDTVSRGQQLVVIESMKLFHEIKAEQSGIIRKVTMSEGDTVRQGYPLVFVELSGEVGDEGDIADAIDPDYIRPDLELLYERRAFTLDENRPDAVERRRRFGYRTARENIDDLVDEGTFVEFGPIVVAAQRARRTEEWLREKTPADGMVLGLAHVNGDLFPETQSRVIAMSYDYTVFAGTQGTRNHYKQDRMFDLAQRHQIPVIAFMEGGGGRPGDTDGKGGVAMDTKTFTDWAKLSGLVPLVGITNGRCFAGNTVLLACCDVIIATEGSTVGMGGPAMIEGGGVGIYTPEEVGPMSFQVPNGVIDILVKDEAEAAATAKKYVSYFQGPVDEWEENDQRRLRHVVPEDRVISYDMREAIEIIADKDSVLEIRKEFGIGIITAFIRVEGKPMGLIANNPHHLGGAVDSDAADKGARFLQLCDAFDLPVVSLMDCPGIMVGPEVERTALVRHAARLFTTGANMSVPMFGLILRKAYGLGVQAMCGGSSMFPTFMAAWPTAEFAGMNIEGMVKLGYRQELADIEDPEERIKFYDEMVAERYEKAKAIYAGTFFGIDDVIDPAESRRWIVAGMAAQPPKEPRKGKKKAYIDTW